MTTLREAAQQALEAWNAGDTKWFKLAYLVMEDLRRALADGDKLSPGEPVAMDWLHKWANHDDGEPETQWHEGYEAARRVVQCHLTAPPQRKPLETKQLEQIMADCFADKSMPPNGWHWSLRSFARAIERAHGIGEQP